MYKWLLTLISLNQFVGVNGKVMICVWHNCQPSWDVQDTPGFLTIVQEGSRMTFFMSIVPEF